MTNPPDRIEIIPPISEEDLANYSAKTLTFAAQAYQRATEQAMTRQEVIDILTASMVECFDRGREVIGQHHDMLPPQQQADIYTNVHTLVQTIATMSQALVPIYEALELYWTMEAAGVN